MSKEIKLALCPFCGGKAELSHSGEGKYNYSYVTCTKCHARTIAFQVSTKYSSDEQVIERWNNRSTPELNLYRKGGINMSREEAIECITLLKTIAQYNPVSKASLIEAFDIAIECIEAVSGILDKELCEKSVVFNEVYEYIKDVTDERTVHEMVDEIPTIKLKFC